MANDPQLTAAAMALLWDFVLLLALKIPDFGQRKYLHFIAG